MPFSTDTNWPQGLRTIFDIDIRSEHISEPFENCYYGPYIKLLNYCFGDSFQYFVAPQIPLSDTSFSELDSGFAFLVVFDANRCPVLFAEIRDDFWTHDYSGRYRADGQIRDRYDEMTGNCPLPRLWGLSLLGTSLRVYCATVTTGAIEPDPEPCPSPSPSTESRGFRDLLRGAWDIDILSPEGFNKMKEIVMDIHAAAAL